MLPCYRAAAHCKPTPNGRQGVGVLIRHGTHRFARGGRRVSGDRDRFDRISSAQVGCNGWLATLPAIELAPQPDRGKRPTRIRIWSCPDVRHRRVPPQGAGRTCRGRGRGDGDDAPGGQPHAGRLRGPRGLQRDPQRHPARHRPRHPRRVLRRRRRLRGDQHVRRQLRQPLRVRHRRAHLRAVRGRRPDRPGGGRRLVHPGPAPLGDRLGRPRHQAAHARACGLPHPARYLPAAGRGPDRRRSRA